MVCKKLKETEEFCNPFNGRKYTIRRSYNCKSSWIIYIAECKSCNLRYVGQTFDQRGFVGRHYGHRQDCQTGVGGLGQHFHQQHGGDMEDLEITIIDSVEPGNHPLLDQKEEEWIHKLKTMDYMGQGGMNIRDDIKRNTRSQCKCKFCKSKKSWFLVGVEPQLSSSLFNMKGEKVFIFHFGPVPFNMSQLCLKYLQLLDKDWINRNVAIYWKFLYRNKETAPVKKLEEWKTINNLFQF